MPERGEIMGKNVLEVNAPTLDTRAVIRRGQQHYRSDYECEHCQNHQQGYQDASPVTLVGVARHQL